MGRSVRPPESIEHEFSLVVELQAEPVPSDQILIEIGGPELMVHPTCTISEDEIDATTVQDLLLLAVGRYGPRFEQSLAFCKVAVNGILIDKTKYAEVPVGASDEVALLPPVSGG